MIDYKKVLENNIDPGYAKFHQKLVPGVDHITGVRVPVIKKLAKEMAKQEGREFLQEKSFFTYEERMLHGLVIGHLNLPFEEVVPYIVDFISYIDNWAICDSFCAGLKIARKHKEEMLPLISGYACSSLEFEARFAAVMLMNYYLEPFYMDRVFEIFAKMKQEGYYAKMAIAWGVSAAFLKDRDKTLAFLASDRLETWTHNKALQKIRESDRVSKQDKIIVNEMKK